MDENISKFLKDKYEKAENHYTHVSLIRPTGRFNIERKDLEEFWEIYCQTLEDDPEAILGLAEVPQSYFPVLNDTDFKLDYNENKHDLEQPLYTHSQMKKTMTIYQKCLKAIIEDYKPQHGICVVLEKKGPMLTENKFQIKQGFHLHFPYAVMDKIDQDVYLIPRVRKEIAERKLYADIGGKYIENSEEAIDKSCTRQNWLLYGSRKKESLQSYKITAIYNEDGKRLTNFQAFRDFKLLDIHEDPIEITAENVDYYLPRLLSIDSENRDIVTLKPDLVDITKKYFKKAKESTEKYDNVSIPEAIEEAKKLMEIISDERADTYDDWMDIGWILYNVGDGCEEAYQMWVKFSSQTKTGNFSEKVCSYYWSKMEKKGKNIGSLYYYAKKDNPEEYAKIQKKKNYSFIKDSLNGGHHDMAKLLYNLHKDKFKCVSLKKDAWFMYENHRWVVIEEGIVLAQKIPVDLVDIYNNIRRKIQAQAAEEEDGNGDLQKSIKVVNKIICSLKSTPFIKNVMAQCRSVFYDANFMAKLNNDPLLIGHTNGVLDLREMRFRAGRPTDYISHSTGYDYIEHNPDDLEVLECEDHLSKIFPEPSLKQYYKEYCANLLRGYNNIKTFLVMSGCGDNGKSINMELLGLVFGDYMLILPTSLIVGKRTQSAAATPEFTNIKGVRLAVLQEPNTKDVINIGILKELSGNDKLYTRPLFQEPQYVVPMFKLILVCNSLPRLPCDDPAAWNRIRVLPHESRFPKYLSDVPKTVEQQWEKKIFPRDNHFSEKLPKLKTAMMWIMFQEYKRISRDGRMQEPERVHEATAIYRENNDVFLQFINEQIVHDPHNEEAEMSHNEVYALFREWFKQSCPNVQIPDKNELRVDLKSRWGEMSATRKWQGYRPRNDEDDIKEGKIMVLDENDLVPNDDDEEKEANQVPKKFKSKKSPTKSPSKSPAKTSKFKKPKQPKIAQEVLDEMEFDIVED